MPEPSDPLSVRLATAPGLATLLEQARATWLARAERDADSAGGERDVNVRGGDAVGDVTATVDRDERAVAATPPPTGDDSVARDKPSARVRPSTPRWRAFEDAFPTFYQFTNRPRG